MEKKTKIQRQYICALEAGRYDKLPDPIYIRNFLKIYLRVLRTDETYYLDLFEQERGTCDFVKQACLPRKKTHALKFLVASRFLTIAVFLLIVSSVVFYLGLQVRTIVTAPSLYVLEPSDGLVTHDATIAVTGSAQKGAKVKVNGSEVLLEKNGAFETEVALERGLNVITIESGKRYSKTHSQYRRVILEQDQSFSFFPRVDK